MSLTECLALRRLIGRVHQRSLCIVLTWRRLQPAHYQFSYHISERAGEGGGWSGQALVMGMGCMKCEVR